MLKTLIKPKSDFSEKQKASLQLFTVTMQLRTAALTNTKAKQLCTCVIAALLPVRKWRDGRKEGWSWMTS